MKRIALTLLAILATIALAQPYAASDFAMAFAGDDLVEGVVIECTDDIVRAVEVEDVACFETFGSFELVRSKLNAVMRQYGDMDWVDSWQRTGEIEARLAFTDWEQIVTFFLFPVDTHETLVIITAQQIE